MKKLFAFLLLVAGALTAVAQVNRPKLVVGLVVDQMRWDYLYYYYDQFGEDGLRRLVDQGYRSEEHTSELQSRQYLVCRLLLEKKKTRHASITRLPSVT